MGTWGTGSFENDSALDWAAEVASIDDIDGKFNELDSFGQPDDCGPDAYIEVDLASEILAAAECVAFLMGRQAADVPDDLRNRLGTMAKPDTPLINKAKDSVSRILAGSELLDLWSEEDSETNEWNIAISGLIDRLNADVPYDPPPLEQIESSQGYLTPCAFCDQPIAEGEIFQLEFRDLSNADGLFVSRGLYCHLACLNGKLHSKHMVQNWKFNIAQAEIDRILGRTED